MMNFNYIVDWVENNQMTYRAQIEHIFGVRYIHLQLPNKDDLYLTQYGFPGINQLQPENYITDRTWYAANATRLSGTSCTYRAKTKTVAGHSLELVLKWNRMGQDIPGAEQIDDLSGMEFNSPFEEIALLNELRKTKYESPGKILTQKPLAIYVPAGHVELWQSGRQQHKMQKTIARHQEVVIDIFRSYIVIYEWVKGIDAVAAYKEGVITQAEMENLTLRVDTELKEKGFLVKDRKPHHIILRPRKKGGVYRDLENKILYALVDFELLQRTSQREQVVLKKIRQNYLKRQRDRFQAQPATEFSRHLKEVKIRGVDYIYGHAESTRGRLWVVGRDPYLFDYFLPERWETTPRTRISNHNEIFHTLTKDKIHLVWKVSRVGAYPDLDPFKEDERAILEYGYNSPFEEISIAIRLSNRGIGTIFPRAIYMTGDQMEISRSILDDKRFKSHADLITPDGNPVLRTDRNYLLIWGYWNGPDEKLAVLDGDYYQGINALNAYRNKLISLEEYIKLLLTVKARLAAVDVVDLNLKGSHLLLSLDTNGKLLLDTQGMPDVRICNFEFLQMG